MFGGQAVAAAQGFIATMRALFEPDPLPKPDGKAIRMASWSLAGLTVLADWIGSRQSWFPYAAPERDARAYLTEVARPRAAAALRLAGIAPARPFTTTGYRRNYRTEPSADAHPKLGRVGRSCPKARSSPSSRT